MVTLKKRNNIAQPNPKDKNTKDKYGQWCVREKSIQGPQDFPIIIIWSFTCYYLIGSLV